MTECSCLAELSSLPATNKILSDDSDELGIPMHLKLGVKSNGNSPTLFNEQPSILLLK